MLKCAGSKDELILLLKRIKFYLESILLMVVIDPPENYKKQKEIKVFQKSCIYITVFK